MFILPKAIYKVNVVPIKIAMTFFSGIEYRILKFINTGQGNLKQDKSGCITIPGLRTYCREVIIIKLACYWHKNRI